MPSSQQEMLTVVAVFGTVLVLMVYNAIRPARARTPVVAPGPAIHPMLAQFVTHQGHVVGEVVAVQADLLVMKHAGKFRAVPATSARAEGGEVRLMGDIDWAKADAEGALWHERNRKAADATVSGPLTTSADVKSPALEAFQREKGPGET